MTSLLVVPSVPSWFNSSPYSLALLASLAVAFFYAGQDGRAICNKKRPAAPLEGADGL
jgi:hypothetical protein